FTSGGTESNNYAIIGSALANKHKGNHIITSQIEHPAVTEVCGILEKEGFHVTYLPVDEYGIVDVLDVKKAITPKTILISIMHANNETGSIQPIGEISEIANTKGIIIHTDAAQSVGKIDTDVKKLGVDLLSIAGHKVYAPKGIGALYIKEGVQLVKYLHGAGQEKNRRAGTENVLEIVGLGKACEVAQRDLSVNNAYMKKIRDRLFNGLKDKGLNLKLNGHPEKRLPNTLYLSFYGVEANTLFDEIKDRVAISTGAACHSSDITISKVLEAMNVPVDWAKGTIRFSVGKMTSESDIDKVIDIFSNTITKITKPD
ncbi:MAG: cysteine desulfurase, partial [Candidatus Omnitrophica bacterium]|nr:cysteine desulfurase [Candidatus Omnitrophota bacterium]